MLQLCSTVFKYTIRKINSQVYITSTYYEGKPLPIGTFISKHNFRHVPFSDKLKPLQIGPHKKLDILSTLLMKFFLKMVLRFATQRNHLLPYYPKEYLLYPQLCFFLRFSDSIQFDIPKPSKDANSDSSFFNSDESLSDEQSIQEALSSSYQKKP